MQINKKYQLKYHMSISIQTFNCQTHVVHSGAVLFLISALRWFYTFISDHLCHFQLIRPDLEGTCLSEKNKALQIVVFTVVCETLDDGINQGYVHSEMEPTLFGTCTVSRITVRVCIKMQKYCNTHKKPVGGAVTQLHNDKPVSVWTGPSNL